MKLVYVGQPYDRFFPPVQNSIGLIIYYTALELGGSVSIIVYGKRYRDEVTPGNLPFKVRRFSAPWDWLLQKVIMKFPRVARALRLDGRVDEHSQYRVEVRRSLAKDQPDVVHVMNYWNWCRDLKAPGSSHRLVLEMQCEWLSQHDRAQVAHQLEVVDAVVTVSDHIAKTFRDAFPGYPGLVATVGNGVDTAHFRPSAELSGAIAKGGQRILFVGRISPEKGIHTLIEAFSRVVERFNDAELQIAGPQSALPLEFISSLSSDPRVVALKRFYDQLGRCTYSQHLNELIAQYRLRDRVRFIGNIPHKDLVATYQTASVVVNPSLSESFGISVVEGMACGVPVVGTRIGGMCESIQNETTGMLVEADEPGELARALIAVLEDPSGARNMSREGRKRAVALYSWGARAERLLSVYQRVLARA